MAATITPTKYQGFPSSWQILPNTPEEYEVVRVFSSKFAIYNQLQIEVKFLKMNEKIAYNVYAVPIDLGCENTEMDHYGNFAKVEKGQKQYFMMARGNAELKALKNGFNVCMIDRVSISKLQKCGTGLPKCGKNVAKNRKNVAKMWHRLKCFQMLIK